GSSRSRRPPGLRDGDGGGAAGLHRPDGRGRGPGGALPALPEHASTMSDLSSDPPVGARRASPSGGEGIAGPAPGLRERKKQRTRDAIQREAMRLFQDQGYEATTIEQIAEAVEISPSTFFNYFPS